VVTQKALKMNYWACIISKECYGNETPVQLFAADIDGNGTIDPGKAGNIRIMLLQIFGAYNQIQAVHKTDGLLFFYFAQLLRRKRSRVIVFYFRQLLSIDDRYPFHGIVQPQTIPEFLPLSRNDAAGSVYDN
jgi:hypothetical protein